MQDFETLRELAMSRRERENKKEREKNAIYSGHLPFCLQPKCSANTQLGPKVCTLLVTVKACIIEFGNIQCNILFCVFKRIKILLKPALLNMVCRRRKNCKIKRICDSYFNAIYILCIVFYV